MKFIAKSILTISVFIPQLLFAQNVPVTHFTASNNAICDSIYTENFTDQSTNNPTSWKWYFPGATPDTSTLKNPTNIMYKGYGCYTVKLVVKNNYGADSLTDSNYICLDSPPNITLTGDLRVCVEQPKDYDTIYAHGGTSYLWFNGSTNSYYAFSGLVANNIIDIKVTVYNGVCSKDTIFPLGHDTVPVFYYRGDTSICVGENTTLYAKSFHGYSKYKYLWSTGSTTDSTIINGILPGSNTYYLTVTNGACVKDSSQITVKVNDCTGIENYSDPYGYAVYPNPCSGVFTLQTNGLLTANSRIEVYNVLGQQVYQASVPSGNTEINISGQPQGVYLYRVLSEKGELVAEGKLIIQK